MTRLKTYLKNNLLPLKSLETKEKFLILSLISLAVLILIASLIMFLDFQKENTLLQKRIMEIDWKLSDYLFHRQNPTGVGLFLIITMFGEWITANFIALLFSGLLWIKKKRNLIVPLWIAIIGCEVFTLAGKFIIERLRPDNSIYQEHFSSFPSGHSAMAIVLYGFMIYAIFKINKKRKLNFALLPLAIIIIIAVGFSRLYLNVHFLSDVAGGYLLGALWLIIAIGIAEINSYSLFQKIRNSL